MVSERLRALHDRARRSDGDVGQAQVLQGRAAERPGARSAQVDRVDAIRQLRRARHAPARRPRKQREEAAAAVRVARERRKRDAGLARPAHEHQQRRRGVRDLLALACDLERHRAGLPAGAVEWHRQRGALVRPVAERHLERLLLRARPPRQVRVRNATRKEHRGQSDRGDRRSSQHGLTLPAGPAAAGVAGPADRRAVWRDIRRDRLRGGGRAGFRGASGAPRGFVY